MATRAGSKFDKIVTMKTASEKEPKMGKLRSLRIEPAANGFTVTAHHDPHPDTLKAREKGNSPIGYREPEPHVFGDHASVLAHVKKTLENHAKLSE
jgi:hypothetical protein